MILLNSNKNFNSKFLFIKNLGIIENYISNSILIIIIFSLYLILIFSLQSILLTLHRDKFVLIKNFNNFIRKLKANYM